MRTIGIIGLLFCMVVPSALAGVVRLDIDNLECIDWNTGAINNGSSLSFLINETTLDSNADGGRGLYHGAIMGGHFWNALTGKTYSLDIFALNQVEVEIDSEFYTGISLRGSFNDDQGNSRLFDLWMEASYKADDYLHNLKSHVSVWSNTLIFNLFEPQDHFEGSVPRTITFSPVIQVPEPTTSLLLFVGMLVLLMRSNRNT